MNKLWGISIMGSTSDLTDRVIKEGDRLYTQILAQSLNFEQEHKGEEIYIDTKTGEYEIGRGIEPALKLLQKLGLESGQDRVYIRGIGYTTRFGIRVRGPVRTPK